MVIAFLDFRPCSCSKYTRLATKLKNRAAYPAKIKVTWTMIHVFRKSGFENSGGCCPTLAAKVSKKTSGKTKMPKVVVRYFAQTARNATMLRKPSSDSDWWTEI